MIKQYMLGYMALIAANPLCIIKLLLICFPVGIFFSGARTQWRKEIIVQKIIKVSTISLSKALSEFVYLKNIKYNFLKRVFSTSISNI